MQGTLTAGSNYNLGFVGADLTILQANSIEVLVSSQNPSAQGSNVTFTATVSPVLPATTTPTGNVRFFVNGQAFGAALALDASGIAKLGMALLPSGTNTVTAAYLGDSNFLGSTQSVAQVVTPNLQDPGALAIRNNGDGTVTISFQCTPNAQYLLKSVNDIAAPSWPAISTNSSDGNGCWTLTVPTATYSQRFFRPAKP